MVGPQKTPPPGLNRVNYIMVRKISSVMEPFIIDFSFLIRLFNRTNVSSVVTLQVDEKTISVLCHMGDFGCGDGGWTPVMKIDGNKVNSHNCD